MKNNLNENFVARLKEELAKNNFYCSVEKESAGSLFTIPVITENIPGMFVNLLVGEHGDVAMRSYLIGDVAQDKREAIVQVLNQLNIEYRFVRLNLDDDGDICAISDFILLKDEATACDQVLTMLNLYIGICNECAPKVISAVWNEKTSDEAEIHDDVIRMDIFNQNGGNN